MIQNARSMLECAAWKKKKRKAQSNLEFSKPLLKELHMNLWTVGDINPRGYISKGFNFHKLFQELCPSKSLENNRTSPYPAFAKWAFDSLLPIRVVIAGWFHSSVNLVYCSWTFRTVHGLDGSKLRLEREDLKAHFWEDGKILCRF